MTRKNQHHIYLSDKDEERAQFLVQIRELENFSQLVRQLLRDATNNVKEFAVDETPQVHEPPAPPEHPVTN